MALTTLSTLYNYNGTYTSATAYTAKNNAAKAWIEDMAAASIDGLTYYAKTSPDPTTSAQTFSVTFVATQGYYIEFRITTSTSTAISANIHYYNMDNVLISSAASIGRTLGYTNPLATVSVILNRYYSEGIYDIYAAAGYVEAERYTSIGIVYTENRTTTAPDYILVGPSLNGGQYLYDIQTSRKLTTSHPGFTDGTSGKCAMFDTPIYIDADKYFLCTLKGCKNIGAFPEDQSMHTYTVGGSTYISVAYGFVSVHVT